MKIAQDLQENNCGAVTFSKTILLQFVLNRFQATLISFFNMLFHAHQTIKEPNRNKATTGNPRPPFKFKNSYERYLHS